MISKCKNYWQDDVDVLRLMICLLCYSCYNQTVVQLFIARPQTPKIHPRIKQVYRLMIDENLLEPYLPHTYDAVSQKANRHIYIHQSTPESGRWIQAPRPVPKQSRPLPKELLASQPSRSKEGRLSSRLGTSFAGASR